MKLFTMINSLYYPKDACPLPAVVMIEPADSCTLKCVMCDVQQQKKDKYHFITLSQFEAILGQFPKIKELIFCGIGEPLLNKDIFSMIGIAKDKKIPFVNLITNGELLNMDISDKLIKSGLDQLHISIPATTEATFRAIRNNPRVSLRELACNIKYITQMIKKDSRKIKIIINIVMLKHNLSELKSSVRFCKDLGADGICFAQLTTMLGKKEGINIDRRGISRLIVEIKNSGKKEGLGITFLTGNDYGRCYQLWNFIMIHADGQISPCNGIMPTENVNIGNIFESNINDIWNSGLYSGLRRKVRASCMDNCCYCESGYLIEGKNLRWLKNFYLQPIRNFIVDKFKNGF